MKHCRAGHFNKRGLTCKESQHVFLNDSALMTAISEKVAPRPLIITVGLHALLLLVLILWRYTLPTPAVSLPDMGMEVNLGTSADGSGTDQPLNMEDPAPSVSESRNNAGSQSAANDFESSNEDDAPSIASSPTRRPTTNPANQDERRRPTPVTNNAPASSKPQAARRPTYVYEGATGQGGNGATANVAGTSEGNTTGSGDRGVPYGTPGASNYTGTPGSGTGGIAFNLSGRNIIAYPAREARFRQGGKVTVRVTVNRAGEIVNKQVVSSSNSELSPIALQKLAQVRFNHSETAPAEQFGTITFVFKTHQ
jgi:TonB family protein